jgi:hypothetical protein
MSSLAIDPNQWARTQRRNRRLQRAASFHIPPNTLRRSYVPTPRAAPAAALCPAHRHTGR